MPSRFIGDHATGEFLSEYYIDVFNKTVGISRSIVKPRQQSHPIAPIAHMLPVPASFTKHNYRNTDVRMCMCRYGCMYTN